MIAELVADLKQFAPLVLLLAGVGFVMASAFEQMQMFAKYSGAKSGSVAGGYNNAMKLMVGNRLGAVLYFFFIAVAIDLQTSVPTLRWTLSCFVLTVSIISALLFWRFKHLERDIQNETASAAQAEKLQSKTPFLGALLATALNMVGLTLPMIWSAATPELRLTLANSGFIFNSVCTFINVFIVETHIAALIDSRSLSIGRFLQKILIARMLGSSIVLPILLLV